MTQNTQYETRRLELTRELGNKIHAIEKGITERNAAIQTAHINAREHGQFQRHHESRQEMNKANELHELNRHDTAKLRELRLTHDEISSGNHPDLAAIATATMIRENTAKHNELAEARAAFEQLMTPEIKVAAQRFIDAQKTASPLLPVSHLAETVAMGV